MVVVYLHKKMRDILPQHLHSEWSKLIFYKMELLKAKHSLIAIVLHNMEQLRTGQGQISIGA
jgi:hypothetical protein